MKHREEVSLGGRKLVVSNLDKVFYPSTGFTKGQVIDYYVKIAPWILPHLKNRPLTMKRYPDGVDGKFFYEKQCPSHKPGWVRTVNVGKTSGSIDYCMINSLPALVWAANLASLELHTFLHVAPAVSRPKVVAFDLDPGEPANLADCCVVALRLEKLFEKLGLASFPKTSGSKGLQVYLPLNSVCSYEMTKAFARHVAEALETLHPEVIVARMGKALRTGRVFIDWSQNDEHKTTVSVYSLRAKQYPSVSTPLTWNEVAVVAKNRKPEKLFLKPSEMIRRVEKLGDLFEQVLSLKQKLPAI